VPPPETLASDRVRDWVERYFGAWRRNDRAAVESLFTADAVYHYAPFEPPARGRDAIVANWLAGGAQPDLESAFEVLAVTGELAVVGWRVAFERDGRTEMDGILLLRFDASGRCREHREWYAMRVGAPRPAAP
jgi:ketosteroid isomerase-like protein